MTKEVYYFRPDSDRFDSLMIDAKDPLPALSALHEGQDVDIRGLKFNYFASELKGDFPSLDLLVPVLSKRAWSALGALVSPFCRIYEVKIQNEDFFALSVRHIVDCLDKNASKLEYFKVPILKDRILGVDELALIDEKIDDSPIFRIREIEGLGVYLSGEFMAAVDAHKLKGLWREQVWPRPPRGKKR